MKLKNYIYCLHHEGHYVFNPDDEDNKALITQEDFDVSIQHKNFKFYNLQLQKMSLNALMWHALVRLFQ
jgi:hypothetical protein